MPRRARTRVALSAELLEARVNPVSFSTTDDYWMGGNVMSVAVGDLNGDGHNDIAAGNGENGVEILLNDGAGEFVRGEILPIGAPFHVELADLNSDGKLDIYVANEYGQSLYTALGKGDGRFDVAVRHQLSMDAHGASAADFNGDGKLDMVVTDTAGAAVYLNNGSPSVYGTPILYHADPSGGSYGVAAGDFNGDGKADFAVTEYYGQRIDVYLNRGNGTFAARSTTPTSFQMAGSRSPHVTSTTTASSTSWADTPTLHTSGSISGTAMERSRTRSQFFTHPQWAVYDSPTSTSGNLDIAASWRRRWRRGVLLGDGAVTSPSPSRSSIAGRGDVEAGV